jgi:hypothetical protein
LQEPLAEAIAGHFNESSIWQAAEALNSVRNKLVHITEPAATPELLQPFFVICANESRFSRVNEDSPPELRLFGYISHIWIIFDALHDVVRVCREKMPLP